MENDKIRETIGALLDGKRIRMAGADQREREIFTENLQYIERQSEIGFSVLEGLEELQPQDYVFLFTDGFPAPENPIPVALFRQMERLRGLRPPGAAVLISDSLVYGTFFGDGHPRREDELGYAGHTDRGGLCSQRIRLAEHLACRMAKEEAVPIRVARATWGVSGNELEQMILAAVKVLVSGKDGEIYNLPGRSCREETVLAPAKLTLDTRKVEAL